MDGEIDIGKPIEFYREFYDEKYIVKKYMEIVEVCRKKSRNISQAIIALDRLASLLEMDVHGNATKQPNQTNIAIASFDDIMRNKINQTQPKEVSYADADTDRPEQLKQPNKPGTKRGGGKPAIQPPAKSRNRAGGGTGRGNKGGSGQKGEPEGKDNAHPEGG